MLKKPKERPEESSKHQFAGLIDLSIWRYCPYCGVRVDYCPLCGTMLKGSGKKQKKSKYDEPDYIRKMGCAFHKT